MPAGTDSAFEVVKGRADAGRRHGGILSRRSASGRHRRGREGGLEAGVDGGRSDRRFSHRRQVMTARSRLVWSCWSYRSCRPRRRTSRPRSPAKNGMVVCVSPEAADVGVAVLKQGGTAVDAAVAVAFAHGGDVPGRREHRRRWVHARLPAGWRADRLRVPRDRPARPSRKTRSSRRRTGTTTRRSAFRAPSAGWNWLTRSTASCRGRTWSCPRSGWRTRVSSRRPDGQVAERRPQARRPTRVSPASSARTTARRRGRSATD